ncbi:hypothetical protein [Actinacidiphila guanduensis]|jgi:hypothetical protein|uniref:Uncharacterized protein n=1 Tax=Actinacidiphila guanduensis TaxID=310781 RepID=A0A1H0MCV8_9ACTN|nr:hypothetical protein [Actinacidiphila guanduensis]SDO78136.1 hypothetical protein SAMN05216259_112156 [Actinacidiphila guanduensis]
MSEVQLSSEERRRFGALVAQVWSDSDLAARYASEPLVVLAEHGIVSAEPLEVPAAPVEEIDDEALGLLSAVGGLAPACCGSASSVSCPGCTASTFGCGNC